MPTDSQTPNRPPSSSPFSPTSNLADALERMAHEAQSQLGTVTQTAYFLGDGIQRALTDEVFDLFMPQTWSPANLLRQGSRWMRQGMTIAREFTSPNTPGLIFQELRNKIGVFTLVKNLASKLNLPSDEFVPLTTLVEKAYSVPPYEALWAVEGLGHYYTDSYRKFHGEPHGLLAEGSEGVIPGSLTMLHAGMGLAFADRLVGELTPETPATQVRAALQQFVDLCTNNSKKGYRGCAIESLGLVTRDFYPDLLPVVSQQFREIAPDLTGYFWHGTGRALYFSRQYFLPGLCIWCDVGELVDTEPEQLSALAGLAWAVSLVNQRQPAITENQLRLYVEESPLARAFTQGVVSTNIMRADTTPNQDFQAAFVNYQPKDPQTAASWNRRIAQPVKTGLESYYPILRDHAGLEGVFRYQDLGKLADQLSGQTSNK